MLQERNDPEDDLRKFTLHRQAGLHIRELQLLQTVVMPMVLLLSHSCEPVARACFRDVQATTMLELFC